jgi:hypothetical protein
MGRQPLPVEGGLEHDPEKWEPVFRKDHAQNKKIERDDDSKKSHPVLVSLPGKSAKRVFIPNDPAIHPLRENAFRKD